MPLPRRQRLAAYAVIVRDERILLSRLAERISPQELWTLPGAASTTARTRATPSCARSARRRGWTRWWGSRRACTPPTSRTRAATAGGRTTTRCGSCTTRGCSPTPRTPGWSRSTGRRSTPPGTRWQTSVTAPCPRCRWSPRRWRTGRRSGCSGSARMPSFDETPRVSRACCSCASPRRASTPVRGAFLAEASTTGSGRRPPWCGRSRRSAGSRRPSATCCTSTTCTSAGRLRPGGSRTSTRSRWCSRRPCRLVPLPRRRGRRHDRRSWSGCRSPT